MKIQQITFVRAFIRQKSYPVKPCDLSPGPWETLICEYQGGAKHNCDNIYLDKKKQL